MDRPLSRYLYRDPTTAQIRRLPRASSRHGGWAHEKRPPLEILITPRETSRRPSYARVQAGDGTDTRRACPRPRARPVALDHVGTRESGRARDDARPRGGGVFGLKVVSVFRRDHGRE